MSEPMYVQNVRQTVKLRAENLDEIRQAISGTESGEDFTEPWLMNDGKTLHFHYQGECFTLRQAADDPREVEVIAYEDHKPGERVTTKSLLDAINRAVAVRALKTRAEAHGYRLVRHSRKRFTAVRANVQA